MSSHMEESVLVEQEMPPAIATPQVEEVMEIPEAITPTSDRELASDGPFGDISILEPDEEDIMEEVMGLDCFQHHQLDFAREHRGMTSDHF